MLKVLYLPIGDQQGTVDGFLNLGCDLLVYDFWTYSKTQNKNKTNEKFIEHVHKYNPDLIHMQLQLTDIITNDTLKQIRKIVPGVVITNWSGDIRSKPSKPFISTSNFVDFSLLSNVGQIEIYKKEGCKNVRYWQIGYDPKRYFPKNNKNFKYDVSFVGNVYKEFPDAKLRLSAATVLKKKYGNRFGLFGYGYGNIKTSSCSLYETNDVYNDSLCVLSISNFNDVSHYFSDRFLLCLASGRPLIAYRFPSCECYVGHMYNALIANQINDIIPIVEFCIKNIDEANKIGQNGHLTALMYHSFTSRIMELLTFTNLIVKL